MKKEIIDRYNTYRKRSMELKIKIGITIAIFIMSISIFAILAYILEFSPVLFGCLPIAVPCTMKFSDLDNLYFENQINFENFLSSEEDC